MIGGETTVALPLSAIHALMQASEGGVSNDGGRGNFAYVRAPADGRLWAINWIVNEAQQWVIGAAYVPHPALEWISGSRIFIRAEKQL